MEKKLIGILIIGLLISTIFPVVSSVNQPKILPQIEIKFRGGNGIHAAIKNVGTLDIKDAKMIIVFDGPLIFRDYRYRETTINLKAGKTSYHIFPIMGLGATNIEITIDTITKTASGKVLGFIAFGVK
jgi:hypothetical protein